MRMFRLLMTISILISKITAREMRYGFCQENICNVMTKLNEDDYKREEFETKLMTFAFENNLENSHKALKEELMSMGHIFDIGNDKPLQVYLMQLLKIIQEETYDKTERLLDDEAVYISQEFRDLHHSIENKLDEQNKYTAEISKELGTNGRRLNAIQVNFEKNMEQEMNSTVISEELSRKLDAIQVNFEKKMEQTMNSTVISEELSRKLDAMQVNFEKKMEQEMNSTVTSEELSRKLDVIQGHFEKKIKEQETNTGAKFDNLTMILKVNLEEQHNKTSALSDVLKLMTEKLDDIQSNLPKFDQKQKIENETVDADEEIVATTPEPQTTQKKPSDCSDLLTTGTNTSGVYTIYPLSPGIKVYCDMVSNGGGWTVFVNRLKQITQENFNRTWEEYKEGFGNASNDYWMGNEALYAMTNSRDYTLRVEASIISEGRTTWGEWAHFKVQSEDDKYKLSVSGYERSSKLKNGTIAYNHGMYFSTLDRDNDKYGLHCAQSRGGFWHNSCSYIFPTTPQSYKYHLYIQPWSIMDSTHRIASQIQMKIRPKNLQK